MKNIRKLIQKILSFINVLIFLGITIIGLMQVTSRYIFNNPSAWTEEVLTYGFTWLALFAATLVVTKREHMRLTFVIDKFNNKWRMIIEVINELLVMSFAILIFIVGGSLIMKLTLSQITPALQMPIGAFYAILPISGILMAISNCINIFELIKKYTISNEVSLDMEGE
ncbi:TRAP transporter small permease [Atopobacter phocae]|uniref:TRAP transporter small permease n=1 Tax=Atopobacter phocae TaxID=136492 RepID=UPI0004721FCC|nr:TRAP transporter small permease [Atopobacter phocae]